MEKDIDRINILTITSLYPNHIDSKLGIFIETRLNALKKHYPDIKHTVIAPVPWFPFSNDAFGQYGKYAMVKGEEIRGETKIYHPKYLVIPKVGMLLTPFFMALSIALKLRAIRKNGCDVDVIDGHYFYPDGVAIALANQFFRIPFTLTARGTDLNLIPKFRIPKLLISWAAKKASHCMAVCSALGDILAELGVGEEKRSVVRNGVNLELFCLPDNRSRLRKQLKIKLPMLVSVGYLNERKGQYLTLQAIKDIPGVHLYLLGDGPDKKKLKQLAIDLAISDRVHFIGVVSQPQLAKFYQAADLSVLASSREGWANVLLESMSCGTPVIATNIWGTPEVVQTETAGYLVERDANSIRVGIEHMLGSSIDNEKTRCYAENFRWEEVSDTQYKIFRELVTK